MWLMTGRVKFEAKVCFGMYSLQFCLKLFCRLLESIRKIGEGTYGEVYETVDHHGNIKAIKASNCCFILPILKSHRAQIFCKILELQGGPLKLHELIITGLAQ